MWSGRSPWTAAPKTAPNMAPMNSDGPKTPPEPPEPMVKEVAASLTTSRIAQRAMSMFMWSAASVLS